MRLSLLHWAVLAALVANIIVYFWPEPPVAPQAPLPTRGAKQLVLVSELPEGSLQPIVDARPVEELPQADEPQQDDMPQMAIAVPDAGTEADSTILEEIEISVQRLSPPAPPPRCWLAGPVGDSGLSERLSAEFAAVGVSMDLVLQTVPAPPDYWVHLPTSGSQAEVRQLSRELRQGGIDNFPITDGALAGSLSLGLFRGEQGAIAVRDRVVERGYPAQIYQRSRTRDEAWIALDDPVRQALGWTDLPGDLAGYPALQLRERECQNPDAPE